MNTINTTPSRYLRTLTACAILGTLTSISGVSIADDAATPQQVVVNFGDLDLSHSAGVAQLYARLKEGAEAVCDTYTDGGSGGPLPLQRIYKLCWQTALAAAVAKVNEPALSALFTSKQAMPAPVLMAAAKAR